MQIFPVLLGIFGASIIVGVLIYNVKCVVDKIKLKKEKKDDGNYGDNR